MAVALVLHRFLCVAEKHLALHFTPSRVPWDEPVEAEDVSHTLWHALVNSATFTEVLMDHTVYDPTTQHIFVDASPAKQLITY